MKYVIILIPILIFGFLAFVLPSFYFDTILKSVEYNSDKSNWEHIEGRVVNVKLIYDRSPPNNDEKTGAVSYITIATVEYKFQNRYYTSRINLDTYYKKFPTNKLEPALDLIKQFAPNQRVEIDSVLQVDPDIGIINSSIGKIKMEPNTIRFKFDPNKPEINEFNAKSAKSELVGISFVLGLFFVIGLLFAWMTFYEHIKSLNYRVAYIAFILVLIPIVAFYGKKYNTNKTTTSPAGSDHSILDTAETSSSP